MKLEDNYSEILDLFTDEEILTICKNTDLDLFLDPIKDKRYTKYTKTLGRLDKRTVLVQKLLPSTAFSLYKKGEKPFQKAISIQLNTFRRTFMETIGEWDNPSVTIDDIKQYDNNDMAAFYYKLMDDTNMKISPELFFVLLKLQDINIEDEKCREITARIITIKTVRDIEKKHSLELEESLKQQEKKLHSEFEHEKQELKKKQEDTRNALNRMQEKLETAELQIRKYENASEREKEQCRQEWFSEYEMELEQRKLHDEREHEQNLQDARVHYQELLDQLENDFEIKKAEKEKEFQNYVSVKKENSAEIIRQLSVQISELKGKKETTQSQLNDTQNKLTDAKNRIIELENREAHYFDSFEQRILDKKIDSLLFEKLGMRGNNQEENSEKHVAQSNMGDFIFSEARSFSMETEYGADVVSLEDFFEDLKCNIAMNFDDETDITAAVLAGVMNHLSIIAVDSVCDYIAQSLSALLDLGKPFDIYINMGGTGLKSIVEAINNSESQVVCIKGILDNYDENMYRHLCELCHDKLLFFSIANIESINMMSKSIMNSGIVIDAEDKLHFTTDEVILINDHNYKDMLPKFDSKKNRDIFKKNFGRLVSNCLIKKTVALRYCFLVQMYNELTNNATMGDIIQKVIISACDFETTDDGTADVLNKCGLTVWSM